MKFFLSGAYSRRLELLGYKERLEGVGHIVTSRWLDGSHEYTGGDSDLASRQVKSSWAVVDLEDVIRADAIVMFENERASPRMRGGAHVEFGVALQANKLMIVIGFDTMRHHIFHNLPEVVHYKSWEDFFINFATAEGDSFANAPARVICSCEVHNYHIEDGNCVRHGRAQDCKGAHK